MIALDTNVLVRFLVDDEPDQCARARALVEATLARGDRLFVSQIVLCELVWVLESGYGLSRREIAGAIRDLTRARQVEIGGIDAVRRALEAFASGPADFADHLILEAARRHGCEGLASFDIRLEGEPDVLRP